MFWWVHGITNTLHEHQSFLKLKQFAEYVLKMENNVQRLDPYVSVDLIISWDHTCFISIHTCNVRSYLKIVNSIDPYGCHFILSFFQLHIWVCMSPSQNTCAVIACLRCFNWNVYGTLRNYKIVTVNLYFSVSYESRH